MAQRMKGMASGNPSVVTAKRSMGISKTYAAMTAFFIILAIAAWNPAYYSHAAGANSTTSNSSLVSNVLSKAVPSATGAGAPGGIAFLAVPLDVIPGIMVSMAVLILFVYDKNSGVLEYMLSLGMTPRDIYMRYLKAALLLAAPVMVIFAAGDILYISALFGTATAATLLPVQLITIPFSLAVVTFMVIAMMAFSSLQKTRAGSNQPIGLVVGYAATIPAYLTAIFLPFSKAMYADIVLAVVIAIVSLSFLRYSGKLIKREKFLP